MRRALTLLAVVSFLVLGVACTEDDTSYQGSWVTPADSLRALPGKFSPVVLQVRNEGSTTWKPGDVSVKPQALPDGWQGGELKLTRQTKPGEVATFLGNLSATDQVGLYEMSWLTYARGAKFGEALERPVEVTCSNGIYCDGEERFADGKCVAGTDPCDDGAACTEDVCDETARTCKSTPTGSCAVCMASCDPDCTGKECGDDGCGGQCGSCPSGQACAQAVAQCKPETQPGTCRSPLPLLPAGAQLLGDHTIAGDTSQGLHQAVPACNRTSTAVESVYTFTVTERVGMEARVSGYDTVLHLRKQRGADGAADCQDNSPARTLACSDDSSPPGEYGSRISLALDPGTYYLIVDGFDSAQSGPFELRVRFAAQGCVPKCDGLYCGGSDGCGGHCGVCASGESCSRGRCLPNPCTPSCDGKECGDDGCGGTCGFCPGQSLCVTATGTCETFPACNHLRPTCEPGCSTTEFCGTDCQCHPVNEPQPDLVLDVDRLKNEILFDTVFITENSCARFEECVTGTGERRVLRFSVEAVNQGMKTLEVPPPAERPDLFTFSPCHGHYHFSGFASYELLDGEGKTVLNGRKQAYCMEDTQRVVSGPDVPCAKKYNCDEQGIQRGWSDLYGNTLDCQWLDITGLAPGDYRLQVTLNPARTFQEASLDNNSASVPVTIPPP